MPVKQQSPANSVNCQKCLSNLPSTCLANSQWHFKRANHGIYSNPGMQVGVQNNDFGTVSPTYLNRSLVPSVGQTSSTVINPLGSKNDQHQFSPNNVCRLSRVKVMRITKLITKGRML